MNSPSLVSFWYVDGWWPLMEKCVFTHFAIYSSGFQPGVLRLSIRCQVRPKCRLWWSNNVYCNRGRQTTGQGRQGSIIQSSGAKVQAGPGSGQARVKTKRTRRRETREKAGTETKRWLTWTNRTNWHRQTENTGINTQGISGEDGRHLEGGGDKHEDRWNRSGHDNHGYNLRHLTLEMCSTSIKVASTFTR